MASTNAKKTASEPAKKVANVPKSAKGSTKTTNLSTHLQNYFGFNKFKGPQEAIIESLQSGKDTFVIYAHRRRQESLLPAAGHDK